MKFPKEFLTDFGAWGRVGDSHWPARTNGWYPEYQGCEVIVNEQTDSGRWEATNELVIKWQDRFWQFEYWTGLTENQESVLFDDIADLDDNVEGTEVFPHTIRKVVYKTTPSKKLDKHGDAFHVLP